MHRVLRSVAFEAFSLYLISQILPGLIIIGGLQTLIFGGVALSVLSFVLKPILNVLSAPLNLITFGLASVLSNAIILLILTKIINNIDITAFTFAGLNLGLVIIPKIHINTFFAFLVVAIAQWVVKWFLIWLCKE
jgi:putative membrane protein